MQIHRSLMVIFTLLLSIKNLCAANYTVIQLKDSEIKAMGIETFTIKNTSRNQRGIPFSATVDFDDKDGYTQNSSLEVVVVNLHKRYGESVQKGEPILEINSNALSQLYFSLQNIRSKFQIAQEIEQKDKDLFHQGVISERDYQTSYLAMNELRLKISEIRSSFSIFGIDPDNARGERGFLVRAAGTGKISVVPTQIGEKIPAFTPYIRIAKPDNDNVLLRIRVPQSRIKGVQKGFAVFDEKGKKIGMIENISRIIDQRTNTISAIARVETKNFYVGEIIEIYIAGNIGSNGVVIPDDCWIKYDDDYIAFVQTSTGFHPVSINLIEERDQESVVESAELTVGTTIAKGSLIFLKGIMIGLGEDEDNGNAQ